MLSCAEQKISYSHMMIRPEKESDWDAVHAVNVSAFETPSGAPSKAWCFLPGASPGREGDQEDLS
jgi:predicted N-acetyltransferase YhbS